MLRDRLRAATADLPPLYWLLWTGTLVNRLGGFVLPFLTLYLTGQRGIGVAQAALMVSLYGAGSFVAQLFAGEMADRWGRRPVLLLSLFSTPVVMIALGLARSPALITAGTLLVGFCTDLYRPAVSAAIADLVPSPARPRAYGCNYWAINVGAAIAPVAAGLLAERNYLLLFVGDAVTTLAFGIIVLIGLRETRPAEAAVAATIPPHRRFAQLGRDPILLAFCALALVFGMIYNQDFVTLPMAMRAHGLGPQPYGLAMALNGLLVVLLSIPISHGVGRWPRFPVMAASALLLGVGFGATGLATGLPVFAISVAIWTLGEIMAVTAAPSIIADLAPVDKRGIYQGLFGSSWGLASFAGPVAGGWVFQHVGDGALWGSCFVVGVAVAGGYLALGARAGRRLRERAGGGS